MSGKIRVGRSLYQGGRVILPQYEGYTQIVVLTKDSSPYGELGPYDLTNENGQILENVWQFSKLYRTVPKVDIPYSSKYKRVVWSWPAETHLDNNQEPTESYWRWRIQGKNTKDPVRNPVGWNHMKNCAFALEKDEPISESNPRLDYIEARKKIYLPIYVRAVTKEPKFHQLKDRLLNGENLLIIEVDGPHQESLNYYKEKYHVTDDFIQNHSVEVTNNNLAILLNDPKHPFGHGYCLGWALYCELHNNT
jgi:hypothetical protein